MIARFAFGLVAVVCWYAAVVVGACAYAEQNEVVAFAACGMVILLVSAGAAFWRGGKDD